MNIPGLSTAGLLKLHGAILEALQVDDNAPEGYTKMYGVRDFSDWRVMAEEIEAELDSRKVKYAKIRW